MSVLRIRAFSRSRLGTLAGGALLVLVATGCQRSSAQPQAAAAPPPAEPAPAVAQQPTAEQAAPVDQARPAPQTPSPVVVKEVGFATPEAVLYDEEQDVYFVSNINGSPAAADGNGFISKVGHDGKVIELKWIDGLQADVTLNAPKGMAIANDKLYVADITFVRVFDRKSGKPLGKIGAVGASFLNDVAAAPDGTIYVSDSGLKAGKEGLEPSGTDAIYRIGTRGTADPVIRGAELNGPNGLVADNEGVWVVSFRGDELYRVTVEGNEGKKEKAQKLPSGGLDGLVRTSDGSLLVSSWDGSVVYRGAPGGTFTPIAQDVKAPAALGYDSKRNALLIPLFQDDAVQIQVLAASPGAQGPSGQAEGATAPATKAPAPAQPAGAAPAQKEPARAQPAAPAQKEPATKQPAGSQQPAGPAQKQPATKQPAGSQQPAGPAQKEPATKQPAGSQQPAGPAQKQPATKQPAGSQQPAGPAQKEPATKQPAPAAPPAAQQ